MARPINFEDTIEGIRNIMSNAYTSVLIVKELIEQANVSPIVQRDQYLKYSVAIHWRLAITELYKLFPTNNKNDKFGLRYLVENIRDKKHLLPVEVPATKIDTWLKLIDNHKTDINVIHELRNSLYAHSTDKEEVQHTFGITCALNLIETINTIRNEILQSIGEGEYLYKAVNYQHDSLKTMLEILKKRDEIFRLYEETIFK